MSNAAETSLLLQISLPGSTTMFRNMTTFKAMFKKAEHMDSTKGPAASEQEPPSGCLPMFGCKRLAKVRLQGIVHPPMELTAAETTCTARYCQGKFTVVPNTGCKGTQNQYPVASSDSSAPAVKDDGCKPLCHTPMHASCSSSNSIMALTAKNSQCPA